ncbi:hypothetical protein P4308_22865 [Bacillus wiedmannii]|uniref:hypothetical protein n=1 Tax=Bacillus cereus group TaxID=86661 RepID=UPI002E2404AC|nr:hypothetical protein [Bacillus wiedmannii]
MKFGMYLGGELMCEHENIFDAYRDAEYCTRESNVPHEVKVIKPKSRFLVEDIDGCEFVKVRSLGNALISYDQDFDGFMTGKIQIVYSDGSGSAISMEEAQGRIDSGEWTVIKP